MGVISNHVWYVTEMAALVKSEQREYLNENVKIEGNCRKCVDIAMKLDHVTTSSPWEIGENRPPIFGGCEKEPESVHNGDVTKQQHSL